MQDPPLIDILSLWSKRSITANKKLKNNQICCDSGTFGFLDISPICLVIIPALVCHHHRAGFEGSGGCKKFKHLVLEEMILFQYFSVHQVVHAKNSD